MNTLKKADIVKSPADWSVRTVGELCSRRKEQIIPTNEGTNRYVGLEHLDPGISIIRRWGNEIGLRSAKNKFEKGDVLYGKLRPYLDKSAVAEWNGVCSTDILVLSPINTECIPEYLGFLLHTSDFVGHAKATTKGVNHPRTSWEDINRFRCGIPQKPEQEKITGVLAKLQRAVEKQDKIVSNLRELKAATILKLFREGLRGEALKHTEIGEIPKSWALMRLENLAEVRGGKRLPKGRSLSDSKTPFPYIRVTDLSGSTIDIGAIKYVPSDIQAEISRYIITAKDIYITIAGTIGLVGAIPAALNGANLTENAARLIISSDIIKQKYLMHFLSSEYGQRQISMATVKNAQPKLAITRIEAFHVPVPSPAEQEEILGTLENLDMAISNSLAKLALLRNCFSSTLNQLMTGRVRV